MNRRRFLQLLALLTGSSAIQAKAKAAAFEEAFEAGMVNTTPYQPSIPFTGYPTNVCIDKISTDMSIYFTCPEEGIYIEPMVLWAKRHGSTLVLMRGEVPLISLVYHQEVLMLVTGRYDVEGEDYCFLIKVGEEGILEFTGLPLRPR